MCAKSIDVYLKPWQQSINQMRRQEQQEEEEEDEEQQEEKKANRQVRIR